MPRFFNQKRIAIIANSLLVRGGVELRTIEFVEFMLARGYEVEVCVLRLNGPIAAYYERMGVRVKLVCVYDYEEASGRTRLHPLGLLHLFAHLWAGRFGTILCVQPPSSLWTRLALGPRLGRRVITMERLSTVGRSRRRLQLERLLACGTDAIVCVARYIADQVHRDAGIPRDKLRVIENGVSILPPHDPQTALRAWIAGRFVIGCVGLLTGRKRQRLILEAVAGFDENTRRGVAVILVGGGEDEAMLRSLVRDLGLEDGVYFSGQQDHPHDFFPLFDVFAFPSVLEGLGGAWQEAMMHGLPLVCANLEPFSGYITHEQTGLIFPADDSAALGATLLRLMHEPGLRLELGARAQQYARQHFDRPTQLARLADVCTGREEEPGA